MHKTIMSEVFSHSLSCLQCFYIPVLFGSIFIVTYICPCFVVTLAARLSFHFYTRKKSLSVFKLNMFFRGKIGQTLSSLTVFRSEFRDVVNLSSPDKITACRNMNRKLSWHLNHHKELQHKCEICSPATYQMQHKRSTCSIKQIRTRCGWSGGWFGRVWCPSRWQQTERRSSEVTTRLHFSI